MHHCPVNRFIILAKYVNWNYFGLEKCIVLVNTFRLYFLSLFSLRVKTPYSVSHKSSVHHNSFKKKQKKNCFLLNILSFVPISTYQ